MSSSNGYLLNVFKYKFINTTIKFLTYLKYDCHLLPIPNSRVTFLLTMNYETV